jgi:hypothetical protein
MRRQRSRKHSKVVGLVVSDVVGVSDGSIVGDNRLGGTVSSIVHDKRLVCVAGISGSVDSRSVLSVRDRRIVVEAASSGIGDNRLVGGSGSSVVYDSRSVVGDSQSVDVTVSGVVGDRRSVVGDVRSVVGIRRSNREFVARVTVGCDEAFV